MNIRIAFRGMDHSDAIEVYARKQLEQLNTFLKESMEPLFIDLVLEAARQHAHHKVELRLNGHNLHLMAHEEGPDLYLALEHTVKKMVSEVKKHKEKLLDKRNHASVPSYDQDDESDQD